MTIQGTSKTSIHWVALAAWAMFMSLILCDTAYAAELESPQRLHAVAMDYAKAQAGGGQLNIQVGLPDSRLTLKKCDTTPEASGQKHGLRMQLRLSCPGHWSIYVPVSIEQKKQVVFAKRSLQSGDIISGNDLELRWHQMRGADYGHFVDPQAVIGRKAARNINAGQILRPTALRQAWAVHKGDHVTLVSKIGSIEIHGRGEAQHDALENARVSVRNLSSGKVVRGTCRGDGIVEIQG